MNYTLQVHGERCTYQVPAGLYELMSDISREVLRDQPDQLYKYIANYMDTLLRLRTNMNLALEVVDDVIADNTELFAYVDERGLTLPEANKYARIIQRTWRRARARRQLARSIASEREEHETLTTARHRTASFARHLDSLGIDYETANKASITIQNAFRAFKAKREMKDLTKSSTHTIDMIAPRVEIPLVMEKPITRDANLQTYQESPLPSINSWWYKPESEASLRGYRDSAESARPRRPPRRRDSRLQVYQESPSPSVDTAWYALEDVSSKVSLGAHPVLSRGFSQEREPPTAPTLEAPIPSYFDADQSKVPMITESGQLQVAQDPDVVTLYSTDTFHATKSIISAVSGTTHDKLPSIKEIQVKSSEADSEAAKEMYSIIQKKISIKPSPESPRFTSRTRTASGESHERSSRAKTSGLSRLDEKTVSVVMASERPSEGSQRTSKGSARPRRSSKMVKMQIRVSEDEDETTGTVMQPTVRKD